MARCNSRNTDRCCPDTCGPQGGCKIYTSSIIYDGPDVPELCIKAGTPLNTVIETMGTVMRAVQRTAMETIFEIFQGAEEGNGSYYVVLESIPSEVLTVTHCGVVVPTDGYTTRGKYIYFNKKYCFGNPFAEIQVTYKSKYTSGFNTKC